MLIRLWPSIRNRISIHALREEGDRHIPQTVSKSRKFLSTPSARRATWCRFCSCVTPPISIHALREEGDPARTQ